MQKSDTNALDRELSQLRHQLLEEQTKLAKDRMPLYEADLELSIKVVRNEIRKMGGLPPIYE